MSDNDIKTFNEYLTENESPAYVVVKGGRVELRRMNSGSPSATFGRGAVYAVLSGNMVLVTLQNGKTVFYKISDSGNSVSGPYIK